MLLGGRRQAFGGRLDGLRPDGDFARAGLHQRTGCDDDVAEVGVLDEGERGFVGVGLGDGDLEVAGVVAQREPDELAPVAEEDDATGGADDGPLVGVVGRGLLPGLLVRGVGIGVVEAACFCEGDEAVATVAVGGEAEIDDGLTVGAPLGFEVVDGGSLGGRRRGVGGGMVRIGGHW